MNSTKTEKEFRIILDGGSGVPFYRQIIQQIEHSILAGILVPGDRLPTIRSLAIELKINPNTIAKAYGELEIRGIVVTQVGSGTYVSDKEFSSERDIRGEKIREVLIRFLREMEALGVNKSELADLVRNYKEDT